MIEIAPVSVNDPTLAATGGRLPSVIVGFGPIWLGSGAGTPASIPSLGSAPIGSIWHRTNGAVGSSLYSKLSTGWTAIA
jgi:hypothetical protein